MVTCVEGQVCTQVWRDLPAAHNDLYTPCRQKDKSDRVVYDDSHVQHTQCGLLCHDRHWVSPSYSHGVTVATRASCLSSSETPGHRSHTHTPQCVCLVRVSNKEKKLFRGRW